MRRILPILESKGVLPAICAFQELPGYEKEKRLFAVYCARQVQHLMVSKRCIAAIDVAERHAYGKATDKELALTHADVVAVIDAMNSTKFHSRLLARAAARAATRPKVGSAVWEAANVSRIPLEDELRRMIGEVE